MKKKICNEATCLEKNPSWVLLRNQLNPLCWLKCIFCLQLQITVSTLRIFFKIELSVKDKDSPLKAEK